MKNYIKYIVSVLILISCQSKIPAHQQPIQDPQYILSSFNNFWTYWYNDVRLSENFIPENGNDSIVTKDFFLKQIASGKFLPLKFKSNDSVNVYKLYRIKNNIDSSITQEIIRFGNQYYQSFKMEGTPLPGFNFVDLNGNIYDKENCKGKVVVLNFWFIGCTACILEMPALNKIVASYKNRNDVLFLSVAPNDPNALNRFLEKNPFAYAVIPNKNKYVTDTLNVRMFPTQMIINRRGLIAKVPEDYKQLEIELRKELLK